jgi:ribose transport system substrate-binding protein
MYLDCGVPVCALEGEGVAAAAQAVGWHYKHVVEGTAPNTIASAWNQAVQQKPTAVIAVATPEAEFANQLAKLRAMGIPYVAEATTDPPGKNGLVAVISTQRDEKERGGWQAAWIAADSKGKANTVLFNVPSFPVLKQLAAAFEAEYRKACPGCKLDVVNVSVNSIGTSLPSQVVSYLESHPDVDYVSMAFADETLGVPEAITAAGLASRVKMVSQNGTPEDFTAIAKGNVEAADVPTAEKLEGWYEMDAALRAVEHMPEPQSVYDSPPRQILIKSNVTDPSQPYVGVPGYPTKFEKLWKVK